MTDLQIQGELYTDETTRRLYATDASAYRELPEAVAIPGSVDDIKALVNYAREHKKSLVPRTAGTSLAGQVVGGGIVVDISRNFGKILEINTEDGYVVVQPGIVRDDLNAHLRETGYFFAPETSTANRAMIGGMIGNNSCGSNSVVYGSTREHLLEVKAILSDGTDAWFGPMDNDAFIARCNGANTTGDLHTTLYQEIKSMLEDEKNREEIEKGYPDKAIPRRNTGYALDMLLRCKPFDPNGKEFNFCQLIAGSEGTLAFVTEAKLKLTKLPPANKNLICIHSDSIHDALLSNLVALQYNPTASELMDHYILDATKRNIQYQQNRFFVEGEPKAILVVELVDEDLHSLQARTESLIDDLKKQNLGYAYPVVNGEDVNRVWGLRKAGLGLLSNVPGDAKPAPVIEDTAVNVHQLPDYISEFNKILAKHDMFSVHYAHAGSGELHLRPILNLKTRQGRQQFRLIAEEIATLVKKYNGSLSGEHGDGRLRGEFIPFMIGAHNYQLCKDLKMTWDPNGIFNPGKITDTPPMDTSLRFEEDQETPEFDTMYDFSEVQGLVRAAEQCNGSGDCRKSELSGGTMCPSYMATRNERETTRARANILREMMTRNDGDPFQSNEVKEVLDLCLSCKGCKSECPSNVDLAKLKGEWNYQHYKKKGIPFRTRLIGNFGKGMKLASLVPWGYRMVFGFKPTSIIMKKIMGFAQKRSMPELSTMSPSKWYKSDYKKSGNGKRKVHFFLDEFTEYNDGEIGVKAIRLLDKLGYDVEVLPAKESGRSYLSKGMLEEARQLADFNVNKYHPLISEDFILVGSEPSTILTFRDEYIDLLRGEMQQKARELSRHVYTIEEFLSSEMDKGNVKSDQFKEVSKKIHLHGHCHQKALSSMTPTKKILQLPKGYSVVMIPSGCCGMAGSFGYEKEHFDISMKIGELVLFPRVRNADSDDIIAAPGTSCRHQIKDGTGRKALHPVEILYDALV